VLALGDQRDLDAAAAFDGFDPARDAVSMAEVAEESSPVWSAQPRIALSAWAPTAAAAATTRSSVPADP